MNDLELEYVKSAASSLEDIKSAIENVKMMKWAGDSFTEFIPTKNDLKDLANTLADKLINGDGSDFGFCVALSDDSRNYTRVRLRRILAYLPELEPEINKKLRGVYEDNDAREPRC